MFVVIEQDFHLIGRVYGPFMSRERAEWFRQDKREQTTKQLVIKEVHPEV